MAASGAAPGPLPHLTDPTIVVVMGVSGCGKSTVAALLAARLGWALQEGDDLHPAANVTRMRGGVPLTDEDRAPWLARVAARIDAWLARGESGVITCSALKRAYRAAIIGDRRRVRLVSLHGDRALLEHRLLARHGHYMPASLLESQLAALEPPAAEERPISIAADRDPAALAAEVMAALAARDGEP